MMAADSLEDVVLVDKAVGADELSPVEVYTVAAQTLTDKARRVADRLCVEWALQSKHLNGHYHLEKELPALSRRFALAYQAFDHLLPKPRRSVAQNRDREGWCRI